MMTQLSLKQWDSAEHLSTNEEMVNYLNACLEENDPKLVAHALGVIAKAKGISNLAHETGITREGLYHAFSPNGNPTFSTVFKILNALNISLHADIQAH